MNTKRLVIGALIATAIGSTVAYAAMDDRRHAVEFFKGHTHTADGHTVDAPEHGGGLDRYGCHNASVPYHCH